MFSLVERECPLETLGIKMLSCFQCTKINKGHNLAGLGVDFPTIAILSKGTPPLVFVYIGEIQTMSNRASPWKKNIQKGT